jgi:hypothetical protein
MDEVWRRVPAPDPPAPLGLSLDTDYRDVAVIPETAEVRAVARPFLTELGTGGWSGLGRGQQGVENRDLARVLIDRQGRTWLSHCCCDADQVCGLDRLDSMTQSAIPYPAFNLLALAEAPDGRIWGGSVTTGIAGQGLFRIDPGSGEVTNYLSSTELPMASNSIQALAFAGDGRLWIGHTTPGGVDIWSNPGTLPGSVVHLGVSQGLPSPDVRSLAAREGEMWVGTAAGIAVFTGTVHTRSILGSALPDPAVLDLAVDGCGRVWAATAQGVAELNADGEVIAVHDNDSVPGVVDERVSAVNVDLDTSSIWFGTANGLSRFTYDPSCSPAGGAASERACTRLCPYPNPFDPGTGVLLGLTELGATGPAAVSIHDALGREVWAGRLTAGGPFWNGRDRNGDPVPSGLYLVKIDPEGGRSGGGPVFRPLAVRR